MAAPNPKVAPTLKAQWKAFKETYLATVVRASTRAMYETSYRRILPELGHLRLDQVTRLHVERFIAKLMKRYCRSTIRITIGHLSSLFSHAIEHGIVTDNPATKTSKLFKNAPDAHPEIEPLTAAEVVKLLRTAQKRYSQAYEVLLCAVHTGLRSAELAE